MLENNFEENVQQKMKHLQLDPSNEVWKKVRVAIAKKRKRKIGWLFFLLLLVCLSAGSYLWIFQVSETKPAINDGNINLVKKNDLSPAVTTNSKLTPEQKNSIVKVNTPETRFLKTKSKQAANTFNSVTIVEAKYPTTKLTKAYGSETNSEKSNTTAVYTRQKNGGTSKAKMFMQVTDAGIETTNDTDFPNRLQKESASFSLVQLASSRQQPVSINLPANSFNKVLLLQEKLSNQKLQAKETSVAAKNRENRKLSFLVSFGVGQAATASNYLGATANNAFYDYTLIQNSTSGAVVDPNNTRSIIPSKLNPGYGFFAGVSVAKKISQKTYLSIGLQYQLLNTSNKVGQVILNADGSKAFETGNNTYLNRYHFLQIPVEFTAQLTNGKQHNIYLHTALSISQLIHTNALQFDNVARQYFISNDYFNKTTVGFSAGLSVNLLKGNDAPLLLGPVMYYSLTPIAGKGLYDNSRYGFLGVRLQKILNRK